MANSSYSATERRGIIAIAFLSLLIIGIGMAFSLCNRKNTSSTSAGAPIIEEVTYMKDSVAYKESQTKKSKKKTSSRKKKDTSKKTKSFRQRSPLDEPV